MDYKALGSRVRRQRRLMGLTQEALAEQIGISPSFLGHVERGTRKASLETLVALCNSLEISADALLADSLSSSAYPIASTAFTAQQRSALAEIYRAIENTMADWNEPQPRGR